MTPIDWNALSRRPRMGCRIANALRQLEITHWEDLANYEAVELLAIRNFSKKSLEQVCQILQGYGLALKASRCSKCHRPMTVEQALEQVVLC